MQKQTTPRIRIMQYIPSSHAKSGWDVVHFAGGESDEMTIIVKDLTDPGKAVEIAHNVAKITGATFDQTN